VERETAQERKPVQDAETAIMEELKDMTTAESTMATTTKPETMFEEMINAIRDGLSDLASSDNKQDREHEEDDEADTELGKLIDDDKSDWVMGTISKTVQQRMDSLRQKQMRLDEVMQPGWGDTANYHRERDMTNRTAELNLLAVVKPQLNTTSATPSPTTFGGHMQTHDIFHGQWQKLAVTARPGSGQMRLGSVKSQLCKFILGLSPDVEPDSKPIQDGNPFEPVSFYPCLRQPY